MIVVKIPKDIREYKEKIMLGLNARQLISVIVAITICIPTYIVGRKYMSDDSISWVIILISFPLGMIGFLKKNGMAFEKYVWAVIKQVFLYPQCTVYKSTNILREVQERCELVSEKKSRGNREKSAVDKAYILEEGEKETWI